MMGVMKNKGCVAIVMIGVKYASFCFLEEGGVGRTRYDRVEKLEIR